MYDIVVSEFSCVSDPDFVRMVPPDFPFLFALPRSLRITSQKKTNFVVRALMRPRLRSLPPPTELIQVVRLCLSSLTTSVTHLTKLHLWELVY